MFIFDCKGFGYSDGFPHKLFLKEDGETAYYYLKNGCNVKSKNIIVWGESLGGVTAVWIASKYKCRSLILLSTFSSLDDALTYRYEGKSQKVMKFIGALARCKMDLIPNKEYIKKVKCPVVIIHSKEDDMIPYQCSKINYDSVEHKAKKHIVISGKHSSPRINRGQLEEIFMFCDLALPLFERDVDVDYILDDLQKVAEKYHILED